MKLPTIHAVALSVVALVPFFHLGYDMSFMLCADSIRRDLHLTETQHDNIVDVMLRCSVTAAFLAGFALNFAGRRTVILAGFCFYTVGTLVSSVGWSYLTVKMGRIMVGLSIGIGLTSGPIYVAEIAPAVHRGLLVSFSQVLYTSGMIFGYMVQFITSQLSTHSGWRVQLAIGVIPSVLLSLKFGTDRFAESPCWLVIRGKLAQAATVMERCGAELDERECRLGQLRYLAGISPALASEDEVQVTSLSVTMRPMWDRLFFPTYAFLGTLAFVTALLSCQSFSGADMALGLVGTYFLDPEEYAPMTFLSWRIMCAVVRMAASLIPLLVVDRIGRRWVLLLSISFMSCVVGVFGWVSIAGTKITSPSYAAMVVAVQAAHALGLGVVPWVYAPETFEFWVRAPAIGIAVMINQGLAAMIDDKSRWLYLKIGDGGMYLVCCGMLVVGFIFCWLFVIDQHRCILLDRRS